MTFVIGFREQLRQKLRALAVYAHYGASVQDKIDALADADYTKLDACPSCQQLRQQVKEQDERMFELRYYGPEIDKALVAAHQSEKLLQAEVVKWYNQYEAATETCQQLRTQLDAELRKNAAWAAISGARDLAGEEEKPE